MLWFNELKVHLILIWLDSPNFRSIGPASVWLSVDISTVLVGNPSKLLPTKSLSVSMISTLSCFKWFFLEKWITSKRVKPSKNKCYSNGKQQNSFKTYWKSKINFQTFCWHSLKQFPVTVHSSIFGGMNSR